MNYSLKAEARRIANRSSNSRVKSEKEQKVNSLEDIKNKTFLEIEPKLLSVRAFNCLNRANIKTIGTLISKPISEISKLRNMNTTTLNEIVNFVHSFGFAFVDEDKNIESSNPLQTQINIQRQENNDILERIKEKESLLEQYNELILEKESLLKREQELDEKISVALQKLQTLNTKDEQKVK